MIVLGWLRALGQTTLDARRRVAENGETVLSAAEEQGALPDTLEGLLAYIGFPWVTPRDWMMTGCFVALIAIAVLLVVVIVKVI